MGQKLANNLNITFYKTSAKKPQNIEKIFETLIIQEQYYMKQNK